MKYPSYKQVLTWIAKETNCEWLADEDADENILTKFLSENFEVEKEKVVRDLTREYKKVEES